jgi:hypothetical protein
MTEVSVLVGVTEKKFTVHRHFLIKTSEFFQTRCAVKQDGDPHTIKFPLATPSKFEIYLQWLYTGQLVLDEDDYRTHTDDSEMQRSVASTKHFAPLVELSILADNLDDLSFSNAVVDEVISRSIATGMVPGIKEVIRIDSVLQRHGGFRRWVAGKYAFCRAGFPNGLPNKFVHDLVVALKGYTEGKKSDGVTIPPQLSMTEPCNYHDQREGSQVRKVVRYKGWNG